MNDFLNALFLASLAIVGFFAICAVLYAVMITLEDISIKRKRMKKNDHI